ncbi:MAG: hypothetical protein K0R78_2989, partial [Pelosinus sp.]|nr:hypothetical protein [Pelosinus sp.]
TGKSAWYTAPATTLQALSDLIVSTPGANKLLKLDANSKLPADITGNAATATKLATARKINTVPFDGSADINLTPAQIGAAPKGYGVGERLTPLSSGYDLNTLVLSGMYIAPTPTNGPLADSFQYGVIVTGGSLFTSQMLVRFESGKTLLYHRHTVNSGSDWSTWKQIATTDLVAPAGYGLGTTANEYTGNIDTTDWKTGFYYVKSGATGNKPYTYGHLIVMVESAAATIKQIWMTNIMNDMQIRQCVNGVWSNWKQIATTDLITPYGLGTTTTQYLNADLNTMLTTGFFYVNGGSMTNYPTGANINAHLLVIARTSIVVQQTYYAVDGLVYTRACNSGTWSPWKQIATTDQTTYITASGTGTGYNWRKWSNGDIEIFGTAAAVINTAGTVTYPITLSTIKTCIAVQNEKGVPNGYVFRAINITTAKFDYNWDTFTTGQGSGSACVIHYHVVGT